MPTESAPSPTPTEATSTEASPPSSGSRKSPWWWVPSLYYAEGLPYIVVMVVSVIMYKRLGISNTEIAFYTSWLSLPWVIKPFWSPLVDVLKTKRFWTVLMQLFIGAGLAGVALTLPMDAYFQYTLALFWLLAFASATHDIAADGFYLLALDEGDQAWFIGIRSTFYRAAMITGQGLLIILAGFLEGATGLPRVEVAVEATSGAGVVVPYSPPVDGGGDPDAIRLVPTTDALSLQIRGLTADSAGAVIGAAKASNVAAAFYADESVPATNDAGEVVEPGWWQRTVVRPLERVITRYFGPDEVEGDARVGNVAVLGLTLSAPLPEGETAVVNLRQTGDANIKLVEGTRLEFTAANWDTPAQVVVQLDPKLDVPATGTIEVLSGNLPLAWSITFFVLAGLFLALWGWHQAVLPRPDADRPAREDGGAAGLMQYLGFLAAFIPLLLVLIVPMTIYGVLRPRQRGPWGALYARLPFADTPFAGAIVSFFLKPEIGLAVAFLLSYRFAEAQLVKLAGPFLLDSAEAGGLALTTGEVGFVYGTVGLLALIFGGILGGILASRDGLKRWLWPMVLAINVPNAVYLFLAVVRPDSFLVINAAVAVEQFGYGFGFTAFLLYLIYVAEGVHKTAHYAIGTGLMALGIMIPGMFSGWLQELIGYQEFFAWVLIATIPSFLVAALIRVPASFGRKERA
ncbi:MAG: MFS transporter [Bacteroidota bacterium]